MSNETQRAGDLTRSIMAALDWPADDPDTSHRQRLITEVVEAYLGDIVAAPESDLAREIMREIDALPLSARFVAGRAAEVAEALERMYARAHAVAVGEGA